MKTTAYLGIFLLLLAPAGAQVFRPEAVNGALLGGVAGAVLANNSGDLGRNGARGAAVGAAAGLLIGQAVGEARAAQPPSADVPAGRRGPATVGVAVGYGRGYGHGPYGFGHHGAGYRVGVAYPSYDLYPAYGYYPGYAVESYPYYGAYPERSAATDGLLLGALAGGIIGHNSGRGNGWRGAAIGAGAGWILGSIADSTRRAAVVEPAPAVTTAPAAAPAAPVTIINHHYGTPTPMSAANGLFGR